jgi:phage terminase small subunit
MTNQPLTVPTHEAFAQEYVRCGGLTPAYREVFGQSEGCSNQTLWAMASRFASRPDVARRIDELRAASLERTVADHAVAIQDAWDIATADPCAIQRIIIVNCRNCHGESFLHQWTDEAEYTRACDDAARLRQPLPNCDGGFGFNAHAEPNPICPHCLGLGEKHEWYCDPTTLTGKEAKLYGGLHPKTGRPMLKDQDAAWDRVCRLMGWNKETVKVPEPKATDTGPMTPERAERAYLALINGGKAA